MSEAPGLAPLGAPRLLGLTVLMVGALVFQLGRVSFDLSVTPLEVGAYLVALLSPEYDGLVVSFGGGFVALSGLAASIASFGHMDERNALDVVGEPLDELALDGDAGEHDRGGRPGQRSKVVTADRYSHALVDYREIDRAKVLDRIRLATRRRWNELVLDVAG